MSGIVVTPWGVGSTVRAIGSLMSHSSTLITGHTATRALLGSFSGGRWKMGENSARGLAMTASCVCAQAARGLRAVLKNNCPILTLRAPDRLHP